MAKIAVEVEKALARRARDGAPGRATPRLLALGDGWTAADVVCTSGPYDRPFQEQHANVAIAIVAAGRFQYGTAGDRQLMTPGSILLGNEGQWFACGHEHAAGDRCLAFQYAPDYFERLAADTGAGGARPRFRRLRLPPMRGLSPLVARACAPPCAVARVTRVVRAIEQHPDARLPLGSLAREAGLSPYHFLRTFERLTGVTPHRYVLRARLRDAAVRLGLGAARILDIAFDCGFGDLSNFNRAFRTEFGVSPRAYRLQEDGGSWRPGRRAGSD